MSPRRGGQLKYATCTMLLAACASSMVQLLGARASFSWCTDAVQPRLHRFGPTTSVKEVASALEVSGVVVVEDRVDKEQIAAALVELETGRMEHASVRFGPATQLWKRPLDSQAEKTLMSLAEDPLILGAAELLRHTHGAGSARMIGNEVRLLILDPGMQAGDLHRDVVDTSEVPLKRPLQWGLNAIWAVTDFTAENGATRFVPGSHSALWPQASWNANHPDADTLSEVATMRAGSVVLYYASLLHGSRENRDSDRRIGLNFNYAFVDEAGGRPAGWGW